MEINLKIIRLNGTNNIWGVGHGLSSACTNNQMWKRVTLVLLCTCACRALTLDHCDGAKMQTYSIYVQYKVNPKKLTIVIA